MFEWEAICKNYGYRVFNETGEALLWSSEYGSLNAKKIRLNWFMIFKNYQKKGHGELLLKEIKDNIKLYFPEVEQIVFEKVTSLGMLNLIKKVFPSTEIYFIDDYLSLKYKNEILDLPEKSPAKYNKDGSCRIGKRAKFYNFITSL